MAGTKKQAAECDVVILATNWVNVPEALKNIDWHGRILIDATNAHMDPKPDSGGPTADGCPPKRGARRRKRNLGDGVASW
jgi:predicted dinucleotide-binding enzyme